MNRMLNYIVPAAAVLILCLLLIWTRRRKDRRNQDRNAEAAALIKQLGRWKRQTNAEQILSRFFAEGSFAVFLQALQTERIAGVFRSWMAEHASVTSLRELACASGGTDFDGRKGRMLLSEYMDEIRELPGDQEWSVRSFALCILLTDDDAKSLRAVHEFFTDPHPVIRQTVVRQSAKDDGLFDRLKNLVLNDPSAEVRRMARERIDADFPQQWTLNPQELNTVQTIHILKLLKTESPEDENTALTALKSPDRELRLAAAVFLSQSKTLERIFTQASRGDREDWERRLSILSRAAAVHCSDFLEKIKTTQPQDVLLLAAMLLGNGGNSSLITQLAARVFHRPVQGADGHELYRRTVLLCCNRGDGQAVNQLKEELLRNAKKTEVMDFILPHLPPEQAGVYGPVLLRFLKDADFPSGDALVSLFIRLSPETFLGPVLDILESPARPRLVRSRALRCLGGWQLDYTMQYILEYLPLLPSDQHEQFALYFAEMDHDVLTERIRFILDSPDTAMHAAVLSCLPPGLTKTFTAQLRDGLTDADPGVRIACMTVLAKTGRLKVSGPLSALLRDPAERVRTTAARIAGEQNTADCLKILKDLLTDASPDIRMTAIAGLTICRDTESVRILIRALEHETELNAEIVQALAAKTDRESVTALAENFKQTGAALTGVFVMMAEQAEQVLIPMLSDGTMKPLAAEILTRTGFVDVLIRRLKHRTAQVRRDAAVVLADIATQPALRGMVLAARDPDVSVRTRVIEALENLDSERVQSLEHDPDPKVRKHAVWAMERIKAKQRL